MLQIGIKISKLSFNSCPYLIADKQQIIFSWQWSTHYTLSSAASEALQNYVLEYSLSRIIISAYSNVPGSLVPQRKKKRKLYYSTFFQRNITNRIYIYIYIYIYIHIEKS